MPYETFFNLPEEKRQLIMDILLDEFTENDYRSASISRIVKRAGIAKGSFYQYFEDKKDCYLYLIQLAMDEKAAFLRTSPPPDQQMDLFATLRWLLESGTSFEFSNPRLARLSYRAVIEDVPLPDEILTLIRQGSKSYFVQMVQQGIQDGTIRPDVDPDAAAFTFDVIFTNLGKYLMERYQIAPDSLLEQTGQVFNRDDARQAMDEVLGILEHGLRPKE